jgi:hypothetical protein
MDFAERFHLTNRDRAFEIAPWYPEDAGIYFGNRELNSELEGRIQAGYALGKPPKIYLSGRWGAGKTHHLYHLKHVLETTAWPGGRTFIAPYFQIECDDATTFSYLHKKMMNALGVDLVKQAVSDFLMGFGAATARSEAQARMFGSANLVVATQVLSIGDAQLAWKWLSGERLSGGELRSLNVTTNLEDTSELVDVLVRIGRLLNSQNCDLIFFVDELEGLRNVTKPNASSSWHDGMRNLADNMNNSVGYVFGIFVDTNNPFPGFIIEDDIVRRMGQRNSIELPTYSDATDIDPFLRDLVGARIRLDDLGSLPPEVTRDSYPFTMDARDLFINELVAGAVSATPSKIIEGLSECAWAAHIAEESFISVETVQEVMPRVTAVP